MSRRGYPHCTILNNTIEESKSIDINRGVPKLIFSSLLRRTIRFVNSKTTSFSAFLISVYVNIKIAMKVFFTATNKEIGKFSIFTSQYIELM